jgi:hypothetical protein
MSIFRRAVAKLFLPFQSPVGKSFLKMRGELASGMSDIGRALPCDQCQPRVVEDRKHLRSMIFPHRGIAPIM